MGKVGVSWAKIPRAILLQNWQHQNYQKAACLLFWKSEFNTWLGLKSFSKIVL